ncbi:MAG: hypothetical protein NTX65_09020 [Ignavibacteriales bacterium]|nr:hypothetical protein [Ignavibacteriales bacterium]
MKKFVSLVALFAILIAYSNIYAQTQNPNPPAQHGKGFVDKNGDGYNDNAPDHDGDGIPNGVDPDYKGPKLQKNKFVDLNGDGINDNAGKGKRGGKNGKGGYGPGNGTGNNGVGPKNGTGNGVGTGTSTGTHGTNGRGHRGGK